MQSYSDFCKLFKKELIINKHWSFISRLAPSLILAVFLVSAFFVPVIVNNWVWINLISLFYLMALWTFFLILYWLDSSTYFWWLWWAREAFLAYLFEPIILVMIAFFYFIFWKTDINNISSLVAWWEYSPFLILIMIILAIAFAIITLWENTRFPFDNPATHLELTMIHEAMLLESWWPNLWLIEFAGKIKLITFLTLFVNLFAPFSFWLTTTLELWLLWFVKILILLLALWIYEVYITKLRIFRYQNYTWAVLMLLIIAFIFKIYFI